MPLALTCGFTLGNNFCVIGEAFSHFFVATGGVPPYTYSLSAWPFGSVLLGMPIGFDPLTGELFGTPSVEEPPWNPGDSDHFYTFNIRVTDANGDIVTIGCGLFSYLTRPPITFTNSPGSGTTAVPYSFSFGAAGGVAPYSFALTTGSLPPGLAIDGDGNITGTPTLNGVYAFEITATGTGGGANNETSAFFQIVIGGVEASIGWQLYFFSYGLLGPLSIQCGDPPEAVINVGYAHSIGLLPGGLAPYTFSIIAGALPTGLSLDPVSGLLTGTPTVLGTFTFTVQVEDAEDTTESVECSILVNPPLEITCDNPPDGIVGTPYSHFILATGGVEPYTFSIIAGALPDGLTLDAATGEIAGTPTVGGHFVFTVRVTDSFVGNGSTPETADVECSIDIAGAGDLAAICNSPPSGKIEIIYAHEFLASGGAFPYVFSLFSGTLPPGLALDPATGIVAGTPTLSGFYEFIIRVTDADAAVSQVECSILIKRCLLVDLTT